MTGYCLWKAKFNENVKVLFLSQGEEEAWDLISKCVFIDNHLPDHLKTPRNPDQKGYIVFPDSGSEIKALPSTEKAGRSTDATIVVCDEWEFHPYAEKNFAALKPTVDAGGQFIGLSTADKSKMNTFFKAKYTEALRGDSGFKPVFLGWRERPGRTEEWFKEISKDLRPWQVEQEYPDKEAQALSTLEAIAFFDVDATDAMYGDCNITPVKCELSDKYHTVKVYKLPVVGNKYCQFTDPSDGKEDPHAIIIIDWATGEEVAESHGKLPADQVAQIHDEMARFYNNAYNDFESNANAGGKFEETIKTLDTPNRHYQDKKKKKGWYTTPPAKKLMIWGLEEAIRHLLIRPHSKECVNEFKQFIQPPGEDPQCPEGGHDDYIMAWGGVWQVRKDMPKGMGKILSFKYKES